MNNSTESTRTTSTISSSSYVDDLFEDYDNQPGESSWATYVDQLQETQEFGLIINEENDHVYDYDQPGASSWATYIDRLQEEQDNGFVFDSLMNEEDAKLWSAKQERMMMMMIKMKASPAGSVVVDEELEDTACSPHSSPTVSYMNHRNMMKLKTTSSNVQDNMLQGRPALTTCTNVFGGEKMDGTKSQKRGGIR